MEELGSSATNTAGTVRDGSRRPQRGPGNRSRGGRSRGGVQGRAGQHSSNTSNQLVEQIQQVTMSSQSGRPGNTESRAGRGRRSSRHPRRGGPRAGTDLSGESGQRITFAGRTFGGRLTTDPQEDEELVAGGLSGDAPEFVPGQPLPSRPSPAKKPMVRRGSKSVAADLPTRIHEDIDNSQYECVICTNEVLRNSRVWSCSICWTVVHLSCVKKWYTNQSKKQDTAASEQQAPSGWRCPGCNSSLVEEPSTYHCWCAKEVSPTSIPGLPPHSCSQTCGKPRPTCPHPCDLVCHAGPCPPCEMMGPNLSCFCGKNTSQKRCGETDYAHGWSCHQICGDLLPCGEHECTQPCHPGLCGSCEIPIPSLCYCGKEFREIPCEQRGDKEKSFDHGQLRRHEVEADLFIGGPTSPWFWGNFDCGSFCRRTFDCGHHQCQKECHTQDEGASHCPFSPDVVTQCPCGKTEITELLERPRESCQEPIPKCTKICGKAMDCGHNCAMVCHEGACPPCTQVAEVPCRCGRTTSKSICHQGSIYTPECFRLCRAQLNCGRHTHDERCCPSEKKAMERAAARRKKKNFGTSSEEVEAEHICIRVCGRALKCGKHTCAQMCHSGPCPTCPEAIFEEVSCHCGRTVLSPPQPCGTRPPECRFDCTRENPQCGHARLSHNCHPDDKPCPPCPFLVERLCICGKQTIKNVPCWFKEPRCGKPCEKRLKCGTHHCNNVCHRPGDCEDAGVPGSHCNQPCLKMKSCGHVDTSPCHSPSACKEDQPCQGKTFVTCECQHRKQEVKCLATKANPNPERPPLKCDDECLRLQRNAKLAAALNIDPATHTDDHVPYSETTLEYYRDHSSWAQGYEREFRVFASDPEEKRLRFKPMKPNQRKFIHALAEDFGLDSESQDPEPHRHVSVFKTPRFVSAPSKTISQCVKIRAVVESSARQQAQPAPPVVPTEPFNGLLLSSPRFGLTIEEVNSALARDLATTPTLTFTTSFLPADEVLIKGAGAWTPQALEASLTSLKPAVAQSVKRHDLAKAVGLCFADASSNVLRREADPSGKKADGWSSVVGRGSVKAANAVARGPEPLAVRSKFVALRREQPRPSPKKKKAVEEVPVDEDWEDAAEQLGED